MQKFYKGYKGLRLPNYDYSQSGFYFITIDCFGMECRFGDIVSQKMIMSDFGKIAFNEWIKLPTRFVNIRLHEFQIMPNHLHAIIEITNKVHYLKQDSTPCSKEKTLSDIIGAYKSFVSNECLQFYKARYKDRLKMPLMGKIWKRSFYDKIILDRKMHTSIGRYIRNNPERWH